MFKTNILCCMNEQPLFIYNPLTNNEEYQQIIINYVTHHNSKWLIKEKAFSDGISILYLEIQIDLAIKKLHNQKNLSHSKLERYCLSLLQNMMCV